MRNALHLTELLANRLCHDLASPLGGMLAALDVAARDPSSLQDAMEAGQQLRRRFQLLRAAWGSSPDDVDARELRALARGMPGSRRAAIVVALQPEDVCFTYGAASIVLNVMLLAAECLPRGGTVTIGGDPAGTVTVALDGQDAGWPAALAGLLADATAAASALPRLDDITAGRNFLAPFAALLIHDAGVKAALHGQAADRPLVLTLDFHGIGTA